jgi:carnitine-CoA ligase
VQHQAASRDGGGPGRGHAGRRSDRIDSDRRARHFSWRQLDSQCRLWADALRRLNVERGEYVVTMMPNTPDAVFAWLGCAWLRAAEVPINTDYRGEWLTHAIKTAQARVLLVSRRFKSYLALVADSLTHQDRRHLRR